MDDSTRFSDAMRLTPVSSDGAVSVFDGMLNRHWTIGEKVHGGAMLALCANAARIAHGHGGQERSDSGNGRRAGAQRLGEWARRAGAQRLGEWARRAGAQRLGNGHGGQERRTGNRHGGDVQPIAVSGSFLWAPDPGSLRVVTTVRKRGRRVSLIDVELEQGGDCRSRGADAGRPRTRRRPAVVDEPGRATDDAGAAAGPRADRPWASHGRHRASGARLRYPAVADDVHAPH